VTTAAVGVGIGIKGRWGEFKRRLELKKRERRLITALGRFGFAARSVVFQFPRSDGLCRVLLLIQQQTYGSVLLGVTAAGLFGFGIYERQRGRSFRREPSPRLERNLLYRLNGLGGTTPPLELQLL
jgi:hypothetical protein